VGDSPDSNTATASTALTAAIAQKGDANLDGVVDFNDLVLLSQHYNTAGGMTWADGDFTGDGNVDFDDLTYLSQDYNTGTPVAADALDDNDWGALTAVDQAVTAPTAAAAPVTAAGSASAAATPVKKSNAAKPSPVFSLKPVHHARVRT
jgi:hypothetical protein